MRTRSSSNLVGESSPNPTTSNPKHRNHRRSKQPFILEESPLDIMADQRTMAELHRAPTEGYAKAIVVSPILAEHFELKHSLINMMTSDQFFRLEKDNLLETAQQMQQIQDKAKKSCMVSFRQLYSHLKRLSQNNLQGSRTESGFKRAFSTLSCQDNETFTGTMFLNVEQLEKQLDKKDFQEIESMAAFNELKTQFQMFITNRDCLNDEYVAMTRSYFIQYTGHAILEFHDTLIQHLESVKKSIDERVQLKREYDSWVNERQMQTTEEKVDTSQALDASSVDTESSMTESKEQDISSRAGNDAHADDADIRPIYDEEPMAEVQTTAEIDVFVIGQQHTKQPEFNNEGEVVQNTEECHDTCPLPAILTDNQIPEPSYQSLESEKFSLKRTKSRIWTATKNSFVTTKTMPIAEHPRSSRNDFCVTKFLKEVNSRAKVPSNKTMNRNEPVEQNDVPHKHERQIPTGHRFSIQKTFVVQKKTMTPTSCLRWKPTCKIFKTVGLRWVPTGRILTSSTTKVNSEPLNGSNADITNQYECRQTLDVSVVKFKAGFDVVPPADKTVTTRQALELLFHHYITMLRQDAYSSADADVPSQQEFDLLFGPLYDEFFNASNTPSTKIPSTSAPSTHTNVHAEENNNDQAEEGEHVPDDKFTNTFCTPVQEVAETSSHNIGNSNVTTFNLPKVFEYRWTKDHPLEQVRGNPSRPVQTR
nr:integrase, catalytic region, zinc finger, CCHC-type, peptidase aspartic, catalytic [Tanacetum cinerariifolium]